MSEDYRVGDTFEVLDDSCSHGLKIGSRVTKDADRDHDSFYVKEKKATYIRFRDIRKINMGKTLNEKFALAFKGEPEKTFIKAGIMNLDESLTTDGQALFLAFLMKSHKEAFKKDVVDPIMAETKGD